MVPQRILFVGEIRLSANGKLDRKSLPDPGSLQPDSGKPVALPEGEGENYIAGLWKEMLRLDHVSREDNFFELGGSSIHIIQMQRELTERFGKSIPVTDLFTHTTVRGLAVYLERIDSADTGKGKVIKRAERSRQAAQRLKKARKR